MLGANSVGGNLGSPGGWQSAGQEADWKRSWGLPTACVVGADQTVGTLTLSEHPKHDSDMAHPGSQGGHQHTVTRVPGRALGKNPLPSLGIGGVGLAQ